VALPLLQRWNFDVVTHGPSLHDEKKEGDLCVSSSLPLEAGEMSNPTSLWDRV